MKIEKFFLLLAFTLPSILCADQTTALSSVEDLRIWTNNKNKNVKAKLIKVTRAKPSKKTGLKATFKTKSGKSITLNINQLKENHKKEILQWLSKNPTGIAKPSRPHRWPSSYNGKTSSEIEYIKYDEKRSAHLYKTKHFDLYSDEKLTKATISKCAVVFGTIVEAIDSLPLKMNTIPSGERPRYETILLSTRAKYMQMGGIPNSGGFFSPSRNLTVIPYKSLGIVLKGNKWAFDGKNRTFETLIHELTHHCTSHWPGCPPWFQEGLADYMAAMPYRSGRFLFTNTGGAITKDISKFKKYVIGSKVIKKGAFQMLKPEILFKTSRKKWNASMKNIVLSSRNYSSSMILMYYLMHEDGSGDGHHLIQWLHEHRAAYLSKRSKDFDSIFKKHIMRDRSYEELENNIQKSLKKKGLRLEFAP